MTGFRKLPFDVRFWARVKLGAENECWEWTGACHTFGHGAVNVGVRPFEWGEATLGPGNMVTSRVAWVLANRRNVPEGMVVMHSCDNPPCCNPAHLTLGTRLDNNQDCHRKGRYSRITRVRGEASYNAVLTKEIVVEVKRRLERGEYPRAIAGSLGVSRYAVEAVRNGLTWQWVRADGTEMTREEFTAHRLQLEAQGKRLPKPRRKQNLER